MHKLILSVLFALLTLSANAEEKKSLKQNINETAGQIDQGTRKAIQEVKTLVQPKEKKK